MKLHNSTADCFVPDGTPPDTALARITHLGIGAHQDDLEFMAFHGIVACYHSKDKWFGGVTCTNGAGSARTGVYAGCTDLEMQCVRAGEQRAAAMAGRYGVMLQLGYTSAEAKAPTGSHLTGDLERILTAARPEVVYTHNLADKHDTHIGVVLSVIEAIRRLPAEARPGKLLGCEIWRGLDWMNDEEKTVLDVGGHDNLAAALNGVFDSQIAGGKRYDLAATGRRSANATFFQSHATDQSTQLNFAMDLTPLVNDPAADPIEYALGFIDRFREDVRARISARLGKPA